VRLPGISGSIRYPGPLRQERRDEVTVHVYSHPAGNFIPTPKEAPVVYAPIGLVVVGLLAFALRRRE